jgi:hypothetical protein
MCFRLTQIHGLVKYIFTLIYRDRGRGEGTRGTDRDIAGAGFSRLLLVHQHFIQQPAQVLRTRMSESRIGRGGLRQLIGKI